MNSFSVSSTVTNTEFVATNYSSEDQWIAMAQKCDVIAFNHLVRMYQDLAYRIAHFVLDDSESAIRATQNAFSRAHAKIRQCPRNQFRVWLLQILVQECKKSERAAWSGTGVRPAQTTPVQIGLATIPFDDRLVCVLSDMIGLTDQEISSVTQTHPVMVREQRSRARRQLRDVIQLL